VAIEAAGGEIIELDADQHEAFAAAVKPIYAEAREQYGRDLLKILGNLDLRLKQ
jgi:TRAP-type C4-dicarboxylate transport system substrate-binding protein